MTGDSSLHQTSFTIEDATALRTRFLALGTFNIVLGALTLVLLGTSELRAETIIGWMLILTGGADSWHAMLLRSKSGYMLGWMSSVLFVFMGILILVSPKAGFTSMHIAVSLLFLMGGALRVLKGLDIRPVRNWAWVVASGSLGMLFGIYVMYAGGQPGGTLPWPLIGAFVGISLIVDGWSRMVLFWVHE